MMNRIVMILLIVIVSGSVGGRKGGVTKKKIVKNVIVTVKDAIVSATEAAVQEDIENRKDERSKSNELRLMRLKLEQDLSDRMRRR